MMAQREAHRQIYERDDVVDYQFMGTDPNSPDNRWLRDAMQQQIPVIYFLFPRHFARSVSDPPNPRSSCLGAPVSPRQVPRSIGRCLESLWC